MAAKIFRPDAAGSASVLGSLESSVMNAVWEIDAPATVGEIAECLARSGRRAHYSSAKTTLNTLTTKGYLTKRSVGKANAFSAALSREEFERRVVGGVLAGLLRNHRNPLIASLAETLADDPASLDEFERLILQQRAAKKNP